VKTIEDASQRSWALSGIAEAQAKAGDIKASQSTFTLALNSAKTIDEGAWQRSRALSYIAVAQAKAGDIKAAFATVETIEDASERSRALRGIAEALSSVKSE
jgi:hypothetical protein